MYYSAWKTLACSLSLRDVGQHWEKINHFLTNMKNMHDTIVVQNHWFHLVIPLGVSKHHFENRGYIESVGDSVYGNSKLTTF